MNKTERIELLETKVKTLEKHVYQDYSNVSEALRQNLITTNITENTSNISLVLNRTETNGEILDLILENLKLEYVPQCQLKSLLKPTKEKK